MGAQRRYAQAAAAVAAAWVLTWLIWNLIRPAVSLLFVAVVVTAWQSGLGPALVASLLASVASEFLLKRELGANSGLAPVVRLSVFAATAFLISWVNAARLRAEDELRRWTQELESRVRQRTQALENEVSERKRAEQAAHEQEILLRQLASELALAEQRERHRLATILHDEIGQSLAGAQMMLDTLLIGDRVDEDARRVVVNLRNVVLAVIRETRQLTGELSPPILYQGGLKAAIEWLADQMSVRFGLEVSVDEEGVPRHVTDQVRVTVFHAVRELLTNAAKRAMNRRARATIRYDDDFITVAVEDDGAGIKPPVAPAGTAGGFGLFSIRERARYLGGSLAIESEPGAGTRAVLRIPLGKEASGHVDTGVAGG
jgi:signal transduction histidine kinase